MAKVAFSKLGLKIDQEVKTFEWNGQVIEVKQYLPVNKKLELISRVINFSGDENSFANPIKIDIFFTIEVLETYTNISFTEKQKEDVCKLYDSIISSGFFAAAKTVIPWTEVEALRMDLTNCIDEIYKYKNSFMGILEATKEDYSNLNLDATEIQGKISDQNNVAFLREVMAKLG